MNFEEWCNSIGMEDSRIVASDMVSMTILKECWDHQQNIINQLKDELKKERLASDKINLF